MEWNDLMPVNSMIHSVVCVNTATAVCVDTATSYSQPTCYHMINQRTKAIQEKLDDSQSQVPGGRPMPLNNIIQIGTPIPNLAHVDTTTSFYTKTSEKVTLQLPHHQSHYNNTDITKQLQGPLTAQLPPTPNPALRMT